MAYGPNSAGGVQVTSIFQNGNLSHVQMQPMVGTFGQHHVQALQRPPTYYMAQQWPPFPGGFTQTSMVNRNVSVHVMTNTYMTPPKPAAYPRQAMSQQTMPQQMPSYGNWTPQPPRPQYQPTQYYAPQPQQHYSQQPQSRPQHQPVNYQPPGTMPQQQHRMPTPPPQTVPTKPAPTKAAPQTAPKPNPKPVQTNNYQGYPAPTRTKPAVAPKPVRTEVKTPAPQPQNNEKTQQPEQTKLKTESAPVKTESFDWQKPAPPKNFRAPDVAPEPKTKQPEPEVDLGSFPDVSTGDIYETIPARETQQSQSLPSSDQQEVAGQKKKSKKKGLGSRIKQAFTRRKNKDSGPRELERRAAQQGPRIENIYSPAPKGEPIYQNTEGRDLKSERKPVDPNYATVLKREERPESPLYADPSSPELPPRSYMQDDKFVSEQIYDNAQLKSRPVEPEIVQTSVPDETYEPVGTPPVEEMESSFIESDGDPIYDSLRFSSAELERQQQEFDAQVKGKKSVIQTFTKARKSYNGKVEKHVKLLKQMKAAFDKGDSTKAGHLMQKASNGLQALSNANTAMALAQAQAGTELLDELTHDLSNDTIKDFQAQSQRSNQLLESVQSYLEGYQQHRFVDKQTHSKLMANADALVKAFEKHKN
ncbi:hypothetical protein [Parendozoicomonas haliclonae]|uniref:Uncharacterized protein n=1 Tax=Parendozoicomonas haliclonae TaxID=1960125 RepID=A0A1X7ALJ8_9GAMM|nr:hypothetical protein [Parendozoicomonas haliclonae]SMA48386.1 hypothetical protein EHSB41UT_02721 [Parendozoicomonas haliclonae]